MAAFFFSKGGFNMKFQISYNVSLHYKNGVGCRLIYRNNVKNFIRVRVNNIGANTLVNSKCEELSCSMVVFFSVF